MKSKQQHLDEMAQNNGFSNFAEMLWLENSNSNITEILILGRMDLYAVDFAKQQAEAVINEIENEWNGYESLPADYAINLIKKHFNIV